MARIFAIGLLSFFALGPGASGPAFAEPAVARPTLPKHAEPQTSGTVFFARLEPNGKTAAIGSGHTLRISDMAAADRVEFRLGGSGHLASTSTRLLAPPGIPFNEPGGSVAGDIMIYALDSAPTGVRVLELETAARLAGLSRGDGVQILGIPAEGGGDEVGLNGQIREISDEQIRVDLAEAFDLRGWGGAPVVLADTGRVIGIVQASASRASIPQITVGPIGAVRGALAQGNPDAAAETFVQLAVRDAARKRERGSQRPLVVPSTDRTNIDLEIEFPGDGAVISDSACGAFVTGHAMARSDRSKRYDVALVLDTSVSTADPTGADINGNGVIGSPARGRIASLFGGSTDEGDSVLAAEVAAARQILRDLDPRSTRVAVIIFAGGEREKQASRPASTLQSLTHEYARAERALDNVLRMEPQGQTHIAGAVDHATTELLGLSGSRSKPIADSEKVVFFFTDGKPTLPYGVLAVSDNTRAVRRSALRASKAGTRFYSFAIGSEALAGPIASVELAEITGGSFIPVRHPGELAAVVDALSFANLEDVALRNETTEEGADPFRVTADGSWGGFVKLVPGANTIRISARANDGADATKVLRVVHEPAAAAIPIPADLSLRHNRLLEDCLRNLKQLRVAAERDQAETVRKELLLEIERERAQARERAAEQRKQLELEIEEDD